MMSKNKESPSLFIVVVNFRTAPAVVHAFNKMIDELNDGAQYYNSIHYCLFDNHSGDGSLHYFKSHFSKISKEKNIPLNYLNSNTMASVEKRSFNIYLHKTTKNGGYGYGNNQILKFKKELNIKRCDQILFLNPDAYITQNSIKALSQSFSNENIGAVGAKITGINGDEHQSIFQFPSIFSEINTHLRLGIVSRLLRKYQVTNPDFNNIDWISGACVAFRFDVFNRLNGFDEGYFLYFEETDLFSRMKKLGFSAELNIEIKCIHVGSLATGLGTRGKPLPSYWFDSRRRFFEKRYGKIYAFVTDCHAIACHSFWRIRKFLQMKPSNEPIGFIKGIVKARFR